jgi:hypothetical protein
VEDSLKKRYSIKLFTNIISGIIGVILIAIVPKVLGPIAYGQFIDDLESVGILHRTVESAAEFVNRVESHPEDWWHSTRVQEVRRNFCEQYANFSHDWKSLWGKEFKRIPSLDI